MTPQPLLTVRSLSKTFPAVKALDDVDLTVGVGEVVALLGHNGSGKSTLVKVLAGVHEPDDGAQITVPEPQAHNGGLHFIHQDLGLVPMLNAVENIDLAVPVRGRAVRPTRNRRERLATESVLRRFGGSFDVTAPVHSLTPAQRSLVAISRALRNWESHRGVLFLDEPTAALHDDEVEILLAAVRQISADGGGIVYISHRLEEVVSIADRVVVLRDGRVTAERSRGDFDQALLTDVIAGVVSSRPAVLPTRVFGPDALTVEGVCGEQVRQVSFAARSREIVGISGLAGSGAETLTGVVFGTRPRTAGSVRLGGRVVPGNRPRASIRAGLVLSPPDRRSHGAIGSMTAQENLTLPFLAPLRRAFGRLDGRAERREAAAWMARVDVRPRDATGRQFALFSGGNQQKIIIAKLLRTAPRVLMLEEPTQGVDVGAKAGIHRLISTAAANGTCVVVASSDTEELASLCDRVIVMRDGRIHAELTGGDLTESNLIRAGLSTARHGEHPTGVAS